MKLKFLILILFSTLFISCPYKLDTKNFSSGNINVIAIPPFESWCQMGGVSQIFTREVRKRFIENGNFKIIASPKHADAVLFGTIKSCFVTPISVKNKNLTSVYSIILTLDVKFKNLHTGKNYFYSSNYVLREEYVLEGGGKDFFLQIEPAIERAAKKFSDMLISTAFEYER